MNETNLKKPSETDWARIDAMTDDDIDTSDIPPLDDAFFASAKWRLPRLYMCLNDLRDAQQFANYIRNHGLHDKKTELRRLERLAFTTALIISYSRPFTTGNNTNAPRQSRESQLVGHEREALLEKDEICLHGRILGLRNEAYAHSDANSHLIEVLDYTKSAAIFRTIESLSRSETAMLEIMIEKWISYLQKEKSKLKESLRGRA